MVSLYHWLGIEAEEPDEDWTPPEPRLEGDGFITIHPKLPTQPTA